ncbi:hypothetical protein LGQ02_01145 [Bacillus shivajii]|uniref:hypothetical protein n=1 Tax=Bacillus shivajii TaxID=1983719 RepID=UPI001CF9EBC9|nr:hypothetical protein [Bacillus shivajii]UCZ53436.1 hypothetical protein LGQ02_01145 [Bacillus shivajii]
MEVALILFGLSIIVALFIGQKYREKRWIICGLTTMFVVAPIFSWIVSILYGIHEGSGFAAIALMMIMFPLMFFTGLVILLVGIRK